MTPALDWEYVADTVMGGVSTGRVSAETIAGRPAHRLTGTVSLDDGGGFIQIASDLTRDGGLSRIEFDVIGNDEDYDLRLRTTDLTRPWQSYRTSFRAPPVWTTLRFDAADFVAHRTDRPFDPAALRRIGIVAVGRAFTVDVAVAEVRLYD